MRHAAGVCALVLAGCGGDSAEAPGAAGPVFEVTDSAGVEIVTNGVALDALPEWTLSAEPTVVLGDGSDERSQLYRVFGAATLPEGGIAVLNQSSREILVFEPEGSLRLAIGGEGEGPGEFRLPTSMMVRDGSVHVWDRRLGRATAFTPDGSVERVAPFGGEGRPSPSGVNLVSVLPDGSFVLEKGRQEYPETFRETRLAFFRLGPNGESLDTLPPAREARMGPVPWPEESGGGLTLQVERFGPRTVTASAPAGYRVGTGLDHEVVVRSGSGEVRRIVRWEGPQAAVTPEDLDRLGDYEDSVVAENPALAEMYEGWPVGDRFPTYDAIVADAGGGFWLRLYRRPWVTAPHRWLAFDADGRLVARISIPDDMEVHEAGPSHLLLEHVDELRVERILRYELRRLPEGAG